MNPNQVNRNQNPLLSCAVTGGFDEFTGSGIVLAAAAEKPVFTIGTPAISDTDNFSDVSLDRDGTSDTASNLVETTPRFYSPLAELDSMGNLQNIPNAPTLNLIQDQQQIDANLNPISAALAQIPNAASTVFSTFSSIIKGSSSNSRLDEPLPNSSNVPPMSITQEPVNPSYMYTPSFDANAPPPAFFSPTDDSLFKKQSAEPAINNTFRLGGAKKKTYAHIPGLSNNQHAPVVAPTFSQNSMMPPMPPQSIESTNHYQDYQAPPVMNTYAQQREPEKTSMFSLTSLLPSQLLEKIPSTKNLFSSSEAAPHYDQQQFNHDQDFSVSTSNYDQPPQQAANFFNASQSNSFIGVSQPEQPQLAPQAQLPTLNFFNPQQFKTSPFTQPKSDQAEITPQVVQNNIFVDLARPPAVKTPPTQGNFHPIQFSTPYHNATSEPPKIDAVSANTNCPPPTFFNPVQANDLFKAQQVDEGRPKNPYSNSRLSRGVGLYKTKPANETANVQQSVSMPPMPEASNFSQSTQSQFPPTPVDQPKVPSRPPSIPPLPTGNYGFNQPELQPVATTNPVDTFSPFVQQAPTLPPASNETSTSNWFFTPPTVAAPAVEQSGFNVFQEQSQPPPVGQQLGFSMFQETSQPPPPVADQSSFNMFQEQSNPSSIADQAGFNMFQKPSQPPSRKKSDLNVPEDENAPTFNFFQTPPSNDPVPNTSLVPSVPSVVGEVSGVNFFGQEPSAPPDGSVKSDSDCTISATHNFFSNDLPVVTQSSLGTSLANLSTQAVYNDTNINDTISDKLDSMSMSENIGSQLSLFATSELDSSFAQKPVAPSESLIPKFLEAQSTVTPRATASPGLPKNYRPVYRHWFYQNLYWHPFAMSDSLALDEAISSGSEVVVTDGGRFEVNMKDKRRSPVYWLGGSNPIRRCSWFYKNPNASENNLIPFDEATADFMESEYEKAVLNNSWNHQLSLPNTDDYLKMNDSTNIEYHQLGQKLVVKRGVDEFVIDDGEEAPVDHLIISVSNFGDKIDDSADELRSKCMETIEHYYSDARDIGQVGRLEILPINLNSVNVLKMKASNSTIEDAPGGNSELMKSSSYQDIIMKTAFYCNQEYYQNIMNHLAFSLNEIAAKFLLRNPEFKGGISLIATSFEALFLFDLLLIQESAPEFWHLNFKAANFYAFGMPSNLLTIRNNEKLQQNFQLKTCKKFLNVVHRFDPIAQRIEPLIRPEFSKMPPESIENGVVDRIDYTIADGSSLESFTLRNYFTSEFIILRITNEIYGALKMDSGSL